MTRLAVGAKCSGLTTPLEGNRGVASERAKRFLSSNEASARAPKPVVLLRRKARRVRILPTSFWKNILLRNRFAQVQQDICHASPGGKLHRVTFGFARFTNAQKLRSALGILLIAGDL